MADNTPNSLEPTKKVSVARMSRWPIYAVLIAGLFLLGILVYSVNFAHNQEEEQAGTQKVDIKGKNARCSWAKAGGWPSRPRLVHRPLPRRSRK